MKLIKPQEQSGPPEPRDLLELEKRDPRRAEALWQGLSTDERLRTILRATAPERLRLITLARDSRELVRRLAADEFTATVLELGPADAGLLVEYSTDAQLNYLLDLTGWRRERFAPSRYQVWLPLILEAGPQRLERWLKATDLELLTLLFAHWFRVEKFLPSQEQQEPPDDLPSFTLDGVYFLEFRDQNTAGFVAQILAHLRNQDPRRYTTILEAMIWESAAQLAEDALRWRQGRLRDHGFPDRLEGLELWAKPRPGEADWEKLPPKPGLELEPGRQLHSNPATRLLPQDELLPSLAGSMKGRAGEDLMAELAYVANCGVVALEVDPAQPEAVAQAARESLGLANMGLGLLSAGDAAKAAIILERVPVAALARQGSQALRRLNHRAFLLVNQGWLKDVPTGLHLLDQPLDRWVAGLLYPRPRCYDPNLGQGREYRSFLRLADLEMASRQLDKAEFWGRLLLEFMAIKPGELRDTITGAGWPQEPEEIKTSALMGTWLARRALGLGGLAPIPRAELNRAVRALQAGLKGELSRELMDSCAALAQPQAAALASQLLRGVLDYLEEELARIDTSREVEPAFIAGLVVEP